MAEIEKDPSVKWKAVYAHHPMFGAHGSDKMPMVDHLLPMLQTYEYDIFFTGHEHMLTYS